MAKIKCGTIGEAWDNGLSYVDLSFISMAGPWYAFIAPAFSKTFNAALIAFQKTNADVTIIDYLDKQVSGEISYEDYQ